MASAADSDSDGIAASPSESEEQAAAEPAAAPAAAAAAARRPGPGHLAGPWFLLLFVSVEAGLWKGFDAGTSFDEAAAKYPFGHGIALGLCQWRLIRDSEILPAPLRKLEDTRFDGVNKFGYVAYQLKCLAQFESPFAMGQMNQRSAMQATSGLSAKCYDFDSRQFGSMQIISDIVAQWQHELGIAKPPKFLRKDFNCQWVAFILCYFPCVFHAVAIGAKLARHRLISHSDPGIKIIQRFITQVGTRIVATSKWCRKRKHTTSWLTAHSVDVMIEWLAFTKSIKDQNDSSKALKAAARVISKSTKRPLQEVLSTCQGVDGTVLRSARVRLDSVALLLFRKIWLQLNNVIIYLYMDSSPQHLAGVEMFAVSMEIFDLCGNLPFERKLLPLISLSRDFLDSAGKATCLCWIAFLLVGPTYDQMARFLGSVISICSDMGPERLIARSADMLSDFCDIFLGMPGMPHRRSLMPLALSAPGWCHGWDVILKRGLHSLSWFPSCLDSIRALIHFFRCSLLVQAFCKYLEQRNVHAISKWVASIRVPSIAEWRWGTLRTACKALEGIFETMRYYWSADLFSNAKDAKSLRRVGIALNSIKFKWQFRFVTFFSERICSIQAWGKGSAELEAVQQGLIQGPADPMGLGRRLSEAGPYVDASLRNMLSEASSWDTGSFPDATIQELDCLKACVRASYTLAKDRHSFLDRIPWLFARLDQPGVKDICIHQYASFSGHHPISDMIMKTDSQLRHDLEQVHADGSGLSDKLRVWVDIFKRMPLDDSNAESPHAAGNRIGRHGSRSSFAWVASTMRLAQNLEDVRNYSQALQADLDELWYAHSSLLQTKTRALHRPKRCSPKAYRQQLYEVGRFVPPLHPDQGAGPGSGIDDNASDLPFNAS